MITDANQSYQSVQDGFFSIQCNSSAIFRPFRRVSHWNEAYLVRRGAALLTRLDPLMGRQHAQRVRDVVHIVYQEMPAELLHLEGSSDLAINQLVGLSYDTGHYFAYIPEPRPEERLGLMVFLHGNAGNFRLMVWRWKALAEQARMAVIAPTYGFGFWGRHSAHIVEQAVADALNRWPMIEPEQGQWLAGLSDGGNGVTRAALVRPWHGLVYLSATMRLKELDCETWKNRWKHRPVLVLNGDHDHNVRPGCVCKAVAALKTNEVRVDHECYYGEDHFLTFGATAIVDQRIRQWIESNRP